MSTASRTARARRVGERLLVALELLPQVLQGRSASRRTTSSRLQGRGPGRHGLRASAARAAATITTRRCCWAISSPPRPAPASCTSRPATARTISSSAARTAWRSPKRSGDDGTFNAWVPLFAGVHVYKAADPVCAALDEAGGLLARGKLVHSYPHSWRSKAPLIFRATPQWFIRMDGPEHIREKALAAIDATHVRARPGAQPHRLAWSPRGPDWCISRQRAWGVPIAVFVDKRTGEPLRDPAVVQRIVDRLRNGGRRRLVFVAAVALPRQRPRSGRLRAGDGHRRCLVRVRLDPRLRAGGARPALAGRPLSGRLRPASRLVPFARCWNRSARAAWRRSRRC